MAIHYPANNLNIMNYDRVLKSLNGLTTDQFIEKVSKSYEVTLIKEGDDPKP